jgi:predicted transcriptional regulator
MTNHGLLPLSAVQTTLGSPARWAILRELADGSFQMLFELAKAVGGTSSSVSKQLANLIADGVVIHHRRRLYQIDPRFIADTENRVLDLGHCLVRLGAAR